MKLSKRAVLCLVWSAPVAALALLFWWLDAGGQAELAAAQARIRAAGLPTSIREIQPPFVPDADNAAPLVAGFSVPLSPLLQNFVNDPRYKPSPTEQAALEAELASAPVSTALAMIREAAAKPGYDARVAYEPGKRPSFRNDAQPMLEGVRLLSASIRLAVEHGSFDEAAADTLAMMRLAELSANEPLLLNQMVRGAIWSRALDNLRQLNTAGGIQPVWNHRLSERLAAADLVKGLVLALDGERLFFGNTYIGGLLNGTMDWSQIFTGGWNRLEKWPVRLKEQKYRFRGVVRREYATYLGLISEMREIVAKPDANFSTVDKGLKAVTTKIQPGEFIGQLALNGLPDTLPRGWKNITDISLAQTGLALERYRMAKGEYPATLGDLVPDLLPKAPADPYTGKPLLHRREPGGGATVWSAGPNLKDDGATGDDLVWRAVEQAPKGN
jgi:hypothetical protein